MGGDAKNLKSRIKSLMDGLKNSMGNTKGLFGGGLLWIIVLIFIFMFFLV